MKDKKVFPTFQFYIDLFSGYSYIKTKEILFSIRGDGFSRFNIFKLGVFT